MASREMLKANSGKEAAAVCMEHIAMEEDKYRLGHTKVFFRAGVLGYMEELRDERISTVVSCIQAQCRRYVSHKKFKDQLEQRKALIVVQRVIRTYMNIKNWLWWQLWFDLKPMLKMGRMQDNVKKLEEKVAAQKAALQAEEAKVT